jgi:heme exporter protein A
MLTVSGVSVARGGVPVIEGVSFAVPPGEALVLQSPNGSGKTTLLRALAGLQPLLAGEVIAPPEELLYAGHLDAVKAALSVAENLEFWAGIYGTSGIAAALERFEIEALSARPAGRISAGQRRRLGLARLLVARRKIWLLDEPTVSLDRASTALFEEVLEDHLAAGGVAVIASHIELARAAQRLDLSGYRAKAPALGPADGWEMEL